MIEIKEKLKEQENTWWNNCLKKVSGREKYQVKYLVVDRVTPRLYAKVRKMREIQSDLA